MKYPEYKAQDFVNVGENILQFWEENQIFEKSISERDEENQFVFYEGPPSANGMPGIHHVLARAIKDIFCRYKTLKGYQVKRKGGWDTHGLPVELQVEKELGITKEDIGTKISVEEYNQKCREAVMKYTDVWNDLTRKIGYWVDLDNPYITYEREYVETLWALLKRLYDKGLIYKGYTVQPFSPAAGTGLSSHELNQPGTYQNVKDTTVVAQFKVKQSAQADWLFEHEDDADVRILAWTTTPWTLPSNSALAVGEGITYNVVQTFNQYTFKPVTVVLAEKVMTRYFNPKASELELSDYKEGDKLIPYKVVSQGKGKDLFGVKYEQLMPYVKPDGKAFEVIPGDFVNTEEGTGIVHIAPTFGADDMRVGQRAGIASVVIKDTTGAELPLVDRQGRFVKEVGEFGGKYVKAEYESDETTSNPDYKSTDVLLAIKLKTDNKAFEVKKYEHSYPHCWRTDKPILYYPMESWFIKTTAVKKRMIELNKTINWKPESTGIGRFGNWLENLVDWNLSRSRFWGTPLPIWRTEDGKEEICIGSIKELDKHVEKAIKAGVMSENSTVTKDGKLAPDFDLHRPFVDSIVFLSDSGKLMHREPDLIDVWFDSGAMPYAQWHYPFENKMAFNKSFPADFIAEGVDQTRGWFFTLHALGVMLEDSVAFKNVVSNGLVLDKKGQKMSKRLGNAVDPFETIGKFGPDVTRWYMIENSSPWDNLKFDADGLVETQRKFFGTLYNTYNFFALYANLDGFTFEEDEIPLSERTELDRWIISKLHSILKEVDGYYEDYEPTKAARAIQSFLVDDVSNWYVRLNRKRFWKSDSNQDKQAAYQTLYTCLSHVAKMMSPIAPFYAEQIFQDLNSVTEKYEPESVHLTLFPVPNEEAIDLELEERMKLAQTASSLVHSIRKSERIKVRQPLGRILIPSADKQQVERIKLVEEIIKSEVNIKSVEYIEDDSNVVVKKVKPNFRKLGQSHGKMMKPITQIINNFTKDDIAQIEQENQFPIEVEGQQIVLTLEDVEILSEDIPGWSVAKDNGLTVALDVTLTKELKEEGIARDIVNRVQNIRKDMGLDVQDKIVIKAQKGEEILNNALSKYAEYIQTETQATDLQVVDVLENGTVVELDDFEVILGVSK
ncbi:MAG: isoleucyl-tRNA synthetase [Bacteroidia bacterium]|jgi:isoleucyl-tRNA synthetase